MVVGANPSGDGQFSIMVDDQPNQPQTSDGSDGDSSPPSTPEALWDWYQGVVRRISENYFGVGLASLTAVVVVGLVLLFVANVGAHWFVNLMFDAAQGVAY